MNSNQKFWSGIIVGAAAGAAIAMFLNSDTGKGALADAKDTADKFGKDIKSKLEDLDEHFKALLQKGKTIAKDAENQVTEITIS